MKTRRSVYILMIFLFLPLSFLKAEGELRKFDKAKVKASWEADASSQEEKTMNAPLYGKEPLDSNGARDSFGDTRSRRRNQQRESSSRVVTGLGAFAQFFMYLVAGLVIVGLVILVLKNSLGGSGRKLYSKGIPELEDGNIQALDTKSLIGQAIEKGDYRLAFRLNYLDILKRLDEKNWIKWEANKTNQDYVNDLSNRKDGADFAMLTYHFDYIWYGDFQINEDLYRKLDAVNEKFRNQLGGSR